MPINSNIINKIISFLVLFLLFLSFAVYFLASHSAIGMPKNRIRKEGVRMRLNNRQFHELPYIEIDKIDKKEQKVPYKKVFIKKCS